MREERKGEFYAAALSILEGWFPVVSMLIVPVTGAIFAYCLTTAAAGCFFLAVSVFSGTLRELTRFSAYRDLVLATFFITLLFVLVFAGLQFTSAGNVAVILFLQLLFAYLIFNVIGREPMQKSHAIGALLMGIGAIVILFPEHFGLNVGDLLVLVAAMLAPIANYYQKRCRRQVASATILTFRSFAALPFLFGLAFLLEPLPGSNALAQVWWLILINGFLIMGLAKILWIESLHRISITKLNAIVALVPIFTLAFAYMALQEVPNLRQLAGIAPILVGGWLITRPTQA